MLFIFSLSSVLIMTLSVRWFLPEQQMNLILLLVSVIYFLPAITLLFIINAVIKTMPAGILAFSLLVFFIAFNLIR